MNKKKLLKQLLELDVDQIAPNDPLSTDNSRYLQTPFTTAGTEFDKFTDYVKDPDNPFIREQDETDQEVVPPPEEPPPDQMPTEQIPVEDPNATPAQMTDPMTGMPVAGPEQAFTLSELGRIYELKKIYSRLLSIEGFLSTSSDGVLLKLRTKVSGALELFGLMISNIQLFKENMDDIIVAFYKFVRRTYMILHKYYGKKAKEDTNGDFD